MLDLPFNVRISNIKTWRKEYAPDKRLIDSLLAPLFDPAFQKKHLLMRQPGEITFLFTSDRMMRKLNRQFRHKDHPTNVLSFPFSNPQNPQARNYLGDVALGFETIKKEAKQTGRTFHHHLSHMIVHGVLHLLGYDHQTDFEEKVMTLLENTLLALQKLPA